MKWRPCRVLALVLAAATFSPSLHAATLTAMRATVVIPGSESCEVDVAFEVSSDRAGPVVHRLLVAEPAENVSFAVSGADFGTVARSGRTITLPIGVREGATSYRVRYRVAMLGPHRCPLLVPDAPTSGASRVVALDVQLAAGAQRLPGEFPAMVWSGDTGRATLGHVPAFVLVPHAAAGERPGVWEALDTRRLVDTSAVIFLVAASGIWLSRQRRR
jgi:hypothetical protein